MKGIDISIFQKGLNLSQIRSEGYEFVILRGSYTGYGAKRTKVKDGAYEGFYKEAKKCGLKVGCYHYSCANTKQGGIDEAKFLYENCLKGKSFDLPIYIDVENPQWQSKNKKGVTDAIIGFCEYIEGKGYKAGVYANVFWFTNMIETKRLDKYSKWVASWSKSKPVFNYSHFDMWQCSGDSGRKVVIQGRVIDTDEFYGYVDDKPVEQPKEEPKKSVEAIAKEVIEGKWGNGADRKRNLTNAGYNYNEVQKKVNGLLKNTGTSELYVIKKGDTLSGIAKKFNTTITKLKNANGIKDVNKIYAGQTIKIV